MSTPPELLVVEKPVRVLGIIDAYGAVHGVPIYNDRTAVLIHSDVFSTAYKRWRYSPSERQFFQLPGVEFMDEYDLDEEQQDSVMRFLERRGWA